MILRSRVIAVVMASPLAAITIQQAGAFAPFSGQIMKCNSGHTNPSPFQLASSVQPPILSHSSSSDEDAQEDARNQVWDGPYDNLFRSRLQHSQRGTTKQRCQSTPVHIILFDEGLQTEGVHTIEFPKQSGSNVILAFESFEDSKHFAKKLGSQMNSLPVPRKIAGKNLNSYAACLGMAVQVVPAGMNLKPPDRHYHVRTSGGDPGEQIPILMQLKEQKGNLDRLIGASPSYVPLENVVDFGGQPAWL